MKKATFIIFAIASIILFGFTEKEKIKSLKLGKTAPLKETKMKDVSGKILSLTDIKKRKWTFSNFHMQHMPFCCWERKQRRLGRKI
jgi:hypothetical protein